MLRRKRLADLPEHWDFGELTPGAQVRVRRSGYYHHGIYLGNGEIVHFDGSPNEQDAAAVRVRRTGMEEFLRGGLPELRIYGRAERKLPPPRASFRDIVQHEPYPVENKAREILQKLKAGGITRFLLLFRGNRSRSEVVATFLAVLELCKARVLRLAGSETDCTVRQEGDVPDNLTF